MLMRYHSEEAPRALAAIAEPLVAALGRAARFAPLALLLATLAYLASGIAIVRQDEVALVLRFGSLVGETRALAPRPPGLLVTWPRPIDTLVRVPVGRVFETRLSGLSPLLEDGARPLESAAPGAARGPSPSDEAPETIDPEREGYVLTGDDNILQLVATARWRIDDPVAYALEARDPEAALRSTLSEAFVRAIGARPIDEVLAEGRADALIAVRAIAQESLEAAGAGIAIASVELESLRPPGAVLDDFLAVQSAEIEKRTELQRARAYAAAELPAARAEARRITSEAEAFAATRLAEARGESERFLALLGEAERDPEALRERLYRETIERALVRARNHIVVPPPSGSRYEDLRITVRPRHP